MYSTNFKTGTVFASEQCIDMTPKFLEKAKMGGIAFVHGAGSQADYCLASYGNQNRTTQRMGSIFPAIAGDAGGDTWGSSTGITRLDGYLTRLKARSDVDPTKYALISGSMGGIVSLNYAAQASVKPKAIVSVIPVLNPNDIVTNNRSGYAASINAAYGGAYNEATMGATYNPWTMRNDPKLKGIPMLLFYGTTDALCLPQYATDFIAGDPAFRTGIALPTGHEEASYTNANSQGATIETFLRTALA